VKPLLDFLNSHLVPQLLERDSSQGLSENIPELLSRVNILHLDPSFLDAIPDEVILRVNVLASIV
jgi:hypothetical protein